MRAAQRRIVLVVAAAAAVTPAALFGGGAYCAWIASLPGNHAPSRIVIAEPHQGEQPLLVEGQVLHADGKMPAAGIVVYVFHADASGYYNRQRGAPPRLRGWVKTDAQGRYAYRTIRPAPYPNRREAAHVHTQLWGIGAPPQWGTSLLFADDPLLLPAERRKSTALGRFAFVCAPRRDQRGVQHCRHDIRLKTTEDAFEANSRHGWSAPPRAR